MGKMADLYARLENFHWSPNKPVTYGYNDPQKGFTGVGVIAHSLGAYAAFNLAFSKYGGHFQSPREHAEATVFVIQATRELCNVVVGTEPLLSMATLLSHDDFSNWYTKHRHSVPAPARKWVDHVGSTSYHLQKFPRIR